MDQAVVFSPDGQMMATASKGGSVDRRKPARQLVAEPQLQVDPASLNWEGLWDDLADVDIRKAFAAMRLLTAVPDQTVPFLQERVQPVPPVDHARVSRWVDTLAGDSLVGQDKASTELAKLGDLIIPALRLAINERPPGPSRQRLEKHLERLTNAPLPPETLRSLRAVQVLIRIKTPESCRVLRGLADGALNALLTSAAEAGVNQLAQQKVVAQ